MERAGFYRTLHGTPPPSDKPRCAVCGDESTGIHYGVNSCEGCKGFFRRCMVKGMHQTCTNNEECEITRFARNSCQYCRFKKCLQMGMSRSASKVGRRPKTTVVCTDETVESGRVRRSAVGQKTGAGRLTELRRSQSLVPLSLTTGSKSDLSANNTPKPSPNISRRSSTASADQLQLRPEGSFEELRNEAAVSRTSSPFASAYSHSGNGSTWSANADFSTPFPYGYDDVPMDYSTHRFSQKSPEDVSISNLNLWQSDPGRTAAAKSDPSSEGPNQPANGSATETTVNQRWNPVDLQQPSQSDWNLANFEEPTSSSGHRYFNGEYYPSS